ncbi:MAG: aminoacyl-histidine dipeptidase, partial [Bacteroidales bacterium]|nr:aminoacyl-histidine dipeptidase [Bacteroidales bacterium]
MSISELKPTRVWKNFHSLTQIPRPSKKEGKAVLFLEKFGRDLGLETIKDEIGNVIIRKPATPGMENRKGIILQAHI